MLSNIKTEPNDSELEFQIALKKAWRLKLQEAVAESKNSVEKDFERQMIEEKKRQEEEGKCGAWNKVELDLSLEFHGKVPGKNKVEKRMKKTEQEGGNHLKNKTADSS
ncbi:uncharacterized protein LOC111871040 isoform X2 [Cryptotermes secundus]|nr:uncharacterized protein LOC111871040 isoform X2 [Cryptotermes secundus]XP_023719540.1 uncharacterized protein LOC111871040 isoform X2 [Cryptotermes secundus]XP_033609968.1 uncharacterized protein LOC111871040 isoform X2 [Cryptotermes secundus]